MEELFDLGIDDNTIKDMIELNSEIMNMDKNDIKSKIIFLDSIGCNQRQIRDIISSNALFLSRSNEDLINLVKCLNKYSFKCLNILFDSNPYILNIDSYEIDNYINNRISNEALEDIIDDLETNPYLFNEM